MNNRAQAAMEYLMTYGWALIVIAVVIGVLWYVTSGVTGGVNCTSKSNNFIVKASAVSAGANGVDLSLQNGTGQTVIINSATGEGDFSGAGVVTGSPAAANGTFTLTNMTAPAVGSSFDDGAVTVNVTYASLTTDFNVVCSGTV